MKQIYLFLLLIVLSFDQAFAQAKSEEDAVKATINLLFDGMRNADTAMLRKAFATKNTLETIVKMKDGKSVVRTENINDFIKSIAIPHTEKYDERIVFTKILIDANLASVWTDYKFYIGDKFSHCGVNSFQLFKGEDGWKIIYLIDTRRKDSCSLSL
ncbi:nuclear transport factor 2 family protein [Pedobacter frigiditerrae]|uniref:nuclear transport factor 2 family protein n=1 Tax=Pedobacter frigiditerrae TaxID=2530452 RepID=UPI00292F22BD|nr:nuclear transport factor 2 family protein [Pedobacter frigiditerrae]